MPLHDDFLRRTPYDELFPSPGVRAGTLASIVAEVEERGMGDGDPGAFALLTATRRALADLRHPDEADDGGHTHAIALFHAYHLADGGEHLLVSTPVARWAVEAGREVLDGGRSTGAGPVPEPAGEGVAEPPAPGTPEAPAPDPAGLPRSAYVQLPQHLFWVRESADERPLSLDGFFWTRVDEALHLLGVVDVQAGETGLRVMPLPGVPFADRELWLTEEMREEGRDFHCTIPGAEIEGLYEVRTAGELLKLAARIDRYLLRFPGATEPVEGDAGEAAGGDEAGDGPPAAPGSAGEPAEGAASPAPGGGPPPSPQPYRRLVLRSGD